MRLCTILSALCILASLAPGQVDTAWMRLYNGPDNLRDNARSLALDDSGNVYVTGQSYVTGARTRIATLKYSGDGALRWAAFYDRQANFTTSGARVAVGPAGAIYVTGTTTGAGTQSDITTVKYTPLGDTLWARLYQYASRSIEAPGGVAVDAAGNVFAAGSDIDATTNYDFVVIKYGSDGVEQWVRRYDEAAGMDLASSVAVDGAGSVYVAGQCEDSAGTAVCTVVKYDADGSLRWVRGYRSGDFTGARAVALDERANVYVGGFCQLTDTTEVPLLVKYDSAGNEQWAVQHAPIPTGVGEVNKLAIGESASVYGAGWYGAGIMSTDFLTAKYSQTSGIEERENSEVRRVKGGATVVRGVLHLSSDREPKTGDGAALLDISGRQVASLRPGANDVRHLAPGIYFVNSDKGKRALLKVLVSK